MKPKWKRPKTNDKRVELRRPNHKSEYKCTAHTDLSQSQSQSPIVSCVKPVARAGACVSSHSANGQFQGNSTRAKRELGARNLKGNEYLLTLALGDWANKQRKVHSAIRKQDFNPWVSRSGVRARKLILNESLNTKQ